jgi:alpha-L-rhamnosidase
MFRYCTILAAALLGLAVEARGQDVVTPLDPTRGLAAAPAVERPQLPEEYIWTAGDVTAQRPDRSKFPWNRADLRIEPHLFRVHFRVGTLPKDATLYLAGPREAHVYLNGKLLDDFYLNPDAPIAFHVFHTSATGALRVGDNVLAIEAIRGSSVVTSAATEATMQLAYGEVLAVKIVPARFGVEGRGLVVSDGSWRSVAGVVAGWQESGFDDSGWKPVGSLGPIEGNVEFRQWSADAGMYGWPGYMGMSSFLRTYALPAAAVTHVFAGHASFGNVASLTMAGATVPFTVTNRSGFEGTDAEAPALLLDFGREVAGRLYVESASDADARLSIAYGESEIEAMATGITPGQRGGNYLGTNLLDVPAGGVARGPKSAFRYVRIRFLRGAPVLAFRSIRVEGIYDPVEYKGSFESSDALLNRIWETGAYTAHLCMQDAVWDAPKRDRGRWAGDLDVEARVIGDVFGDAALVKETLRQLAPMKGGHVNGIPGYSAQWVTALAGVYERSGDVEFLRTQRDALLRVLGAMDASVREGGTFESSKRSWLFIDWAPGLYGDTADARVGTQLQFVRAYRAAGVLLRVLGDDADADRYVAQAAKVLRAAGSAYGRTWQVNALATLVDPGAGGASWTGVLSHVKQDAPTDQVISPYFNSYVLDAMAVTDHRREALEWMRAYWGGMLAEGATSFWESYDLRWPKTNAHLSLQADGTSGYFVSFAHGWSAGPTAWLSENVLGVSQPLDGYKTVVIRPDLAGLDWAKGTVPTPHGLIRVSVDKAKGIALDLPQGIEHAFVYVATPGGGRRVYLDGVTAGTVTGPGRETMVEITHGGHFEVTER